MTKATINEIANKILVYLENISTGTEICTREVFLCVYGQDFFNNSCAINGEPIEDFDLIEVDYLVRKIAYRHKLILDSSHYDNMVTGLPHNIPYIIKRRK